MIPRGLTRLSLPFVFVLAAACGGGDDDDPLQPLAPPPVNPNLTVLAQGTVEQEIPADGLWNLAPSRMAAQEGIATPCERLVFLFSWRTEDKDSIEFTSVTQGKDSVRVGEGAEGVASVGGCLVVGAHNGGGSAVKVEMRYVLAETR